MTAPHPDDAPMVRAKALALSMGKEAIRVAQKNVPYAHVIIADANKLLAKYDLVLVLDASSPSVEVMTEGAFRDLCAEATAK